MVTSEITDLYYRVESAKRQIETYRTVILPQARQSVQASVAAYQTGRTDFLMLIDAYRTLVDLSMERLMLRMQFEQEVAELERAAGYMDIARLKG
jgi:cobalt-zinc-cadmium efflux system outer membrane protein